ncbi:MAG: pro-sigmaK processing inhibitor BofA family protein [Clostridia bacterium]|nr:pro-sigmaK processing inhibitor BofA family protein [Clostridia bacterium]
MVYKILIPLLLILIFCIFKIFKEPKPFLKSIKSVFFSTAALITLHTLIPALGISMPINLPTILTAGILGIPGICLMTILNVVF